ncbi:hypothetical protein Tco_1243328 [Tanacetum coccineum]
MEVAFRKLLDIFVDTDGLNYLKVPVVSNYTLFSVEEIEKSSPICLLSKSLQDKSWLWASAFKPLELRYHQWIFALESFTKKDNASSGSHISSTHWIIIPTLRTIMVEQGEYMQKLNRYAAKLIIEPFVNVFAPDYNSEASSSGEITIPEPNQSTLPHEHIRKWTNSHPLDNIIGNPSRPVSTRKQLATDALWCFYNSILSKVELKNFKSPSYRRLLFQAKLQEEIQKLIDWT